MKEKLKPGHEVLLWKLLLTGEEPKISEARPGVSTKEIQYIVDAGIICLEKRGRSKHITLTEKAWDWLPNNPPQGIERSRSPECARVLHEILGKLVSYIQQNDLSIHDVLAETGFLAGDVPEVDIEQAIVSACEALSKGKHNVRIKLSILRKQLEDISKKTLDRVLLEMAKKERIALMPLDDSTEIQSEDIDAGIDIAGFTQHIIYIKS